MWIRRSRLEELETKGRCWDRERRRQQQEEQKEHERARKKKTLYIPTEHESEVWELFAHHLPIYSDKRIISYVCDEVTHGEHLFHTFTEKLQPGFIEPGHQYEVQLSYTLRECQLHLLEAAL